MAPIVIKPRLQIVFLVACFGVFGCVGVSMFTAGDIVAKRDWFSLVLYPLITIGAAVGIWRTVRMGVVIDARGITVKGLDSRDRTTPWDQVAAIECEQIDVRGGLPLYGPVVRLVDGGVLAIRTLGSYSQEGAQRRVEQLLAFRQTA